MSSFEFRPQAIQCDREKSPGFCTVFCFGKRTLVDTVPTIKEVSYTYPRSPVPPQLVGRVDDVFWAKTFDAVEDLVKNELERLKESLTGPGSGLPFIPCCVCCLIWAQSKEYPLAKERQIQSGKEWMALVEEEQKRYQPYGVNVSLATDYVLTGNDSHRHLKQQPVGLKFDVGSVAGGVAAPTMSPSMMETTGVVTQTMNRPPPADLGTELEKLNNLRMQGALTEAEYQAAKDKLLSN